MEDGASDGDDEGGHHRFGVSWFEPMEGPKNDSDGNIEPDMRRALLEELQEIHWVIVGILRHCCDWSMLCDSWIAIIQLGARLSRVSRSPQAATPEMVEQTDCQHVEVRFR